MKSIAENDKKRVMQNVLIKRTRVAIFRDTRYPNRSVRDALRILLF